MPKASQFTRISFTARAGRRQPSGAAAGPAHFLQKRERERDPLCFRLTHLACSAPVVFSFHYCSARIRNKESPFCSKMLGPLGRELFVSLFFFFWDPRSRRRQHILDPNPRICDIMRSYCNFNIKKDNYAVCHSFFSSLLASSSIMSCLDGCCISLPYC